MGTFTMRVENDLKRDASRVCESYGLDLTTATRALWMQIARTGNVPLQMWRDEPNDETLAAMAEIDEMIASNVEPQFTSVKDAMASLRG